MNFIIYLILSILSKLFASAREFGIGYFWGAGSLVDAFIIAMMLPMFFIDVSNVLFNSTYISIFVKNNRVGKKRFFKDIIYFCSGYIILSGFLVFIFLKCYILYADIPIETKRILNDIVYYILVYYSLMVYCEFYKAHIVACENQRLMPLPMIFANIIFIVSMYYISGSKGNLALVVCFIFSAIIQYLMYLSLILFKRREDNSGHFGNVVSDKEIRKLNTRTFYKNIIPVAFNSAVTQSSKITDKLIASGLLVGSLSSLYFAQQLYALYVNIIIVSVLTFAYPKICSKSSVKLEMAKYVNDVLFLLIVLLTLPVVLGWYFSNVVFTILLNNTSPHKVALASSMFNWLSLAVYFEAINATIKRAYWAIDKMKITVYNSALAVVLNVVLSLIFSKYFGVIGLVISYCISNFVASVLLIKIYYRDFGVILSMKQGKVLITILTISLLLYAILNSFTIDTNTPTDFILPIIISLCGIAFYILIIIKSNLFKVLAS